MRLASMRQRRDPDLRLRELKLSVVPRPKTLQSQGHYREEEAMHTTSFRSSKAARRRGNAWYTTTAIIPNPQDFALRARSAIGRESRGVLGHNLLLKKRLTW